MSPNPGQLLSRRQFLKASAALGLSAAGMAMLSGCGISPPQLNGPEGVLETTTIRLPEIPNSICVAPVYLAEDFLRKEGFTDVQYVSSTALLAFGSLASGEIDMGLVFSGPTLTYIDAGKPMTILSGVHVGCFELFGAEQIHTILDLKGKTVSITDIGGPDHSFLSSMAAYVGMDPNKEINWVTGPQGQAKQLFIDGKVDAFLAFPPAAQELRAKKIGQVVVNSMMDKPWSQYFCCMIAANREFVQKNPVATKRVVRAILKAADICALQPERAARFIVDKGYTPNYDYALEAMQNIPYNRWREYDPTDTLRFYALRLHEAGMVKSSPEQLIAQGTDWRFLNEIKREPLG